MQSKVQKWGNSLAIRIPNGMAQESGLHHDGSVDLRVEAGCLVVAPLPRPRYRLEELLEAVSPGNLHGETDLGPLVGSESW